MTAKSNQPVTISNELGLFVRGLVMTKNVFESDKGKKYSIDLAVPGARDLITVSVDKDTYDKLDITNPFESSLSYKTWKGVSYFSHPSAV